MYAKDIVTHEDTPEHIGQSWFDESGAEDRTLRFLENQDDLGIDQNTATVLDIGTGNGSMLKGFREEGWQGQLWGVDYSLESVRLARRILGTSNDTKGPSETMTANEKAVDEAPEPVKGIYIVQHDILADWPPPELERISPPTQFDLVHDKGTFDAISLSTDAASACPIYRCRVEALVRPGGLLLITSCNWTEDELELWITGCSQSAFTRVGRIGYSRYKFGGHEGGSLAGLCWRRTE